MTKAIRQWNEANGKFSDWCQTLPIPLILPACEIHGEIQDAVRAIVKERDDALRELESASAALDRLRRSAGQMISEINGKLDALLAKRQVNDDR